VRDLKKLQVWEKSHPLTLAIYRVTAELPKEEMYGLTSQMRQASASIPANISEGCGRGSDADLARFLNIAMGSAKELEYHLLLAYDLDYLKPDEYQELASRSTEIQRMLTGSIKYLGAVTRPDYT
jgi:four helix bundle protein